MSDSGVRSRKRNQTSSSWRPASPTRSSYDRSAVGEALRINAMSSAITIRRRHRRGDERAVSSRASDAIPSRALTWSIACSSSWAATSTSTRRPSRARSLWRPPIETETDRPHRRALHSARHENDAVNGRFDRCGKARAERLDSYAAVFPQARAQQHRGQRGERWDGFHEERAQFISGHRPSSRRDRYGHAFGRRLQRDRKRDQSLLGAVADSARGADVAVADLHNRKSETFSWRAEPQPGSRRGCRGADWCRARLRRVVGSARAGGGRDRRLPRRRA